MVTKRLLMYVEVEILHVQARYESLRELLRYWRNSSIGIRVSSSTCKSANVEGTVRRLYSEAWGTSSVLAFKDDLSFGSHAIAIRDVQAEAMSGLATVRT